MPVVTNLEQKILQLIRQDKYSWFTVGVNLAGEPGTSGGSGVPPGGFTGQLIQSRVTYDTSEAASLDVPVSLSGASLLHNLNRIRYWLNEKNPAFIVQDEGVEIASGIAVLDFIGAPVTVTLVSGYIDRVAITISGTGGGNGNGDTVKVSSDDTTTNYLDAKITVVSPISKTVNNPAGNENLELSFVGIPIADLTDVTITSVGADEILGYSGGWINRTLTEAGISAEGHTHVETDITDLEHDAIKFQTRTVSTDAPSDGDTFRWRSSASEWIPSGIVGGGGGGTDTKQVKVSSNDTTEGYLEDKIVEGDYITLTVLNEGANETLEITSTASGGAGGVDVEEGGTPKVTDATVLNFVSGAEVTDAGGGQADITVSGGTGGGGAADFTIWMPDAPPATAYSSGGTDDDEFDDASFDTGIWSEFDVAITQTVGEDEFGVYMTTTSINHLQGIYQPVPTGSDWSFTIYVGPHWDRDNQHRTGILLIEDTGNLSTSDCFLWSHYRGSAGFGWQAIYHTDYDTWSADDHNSVTDNKPSAMYLRFRRDGTNWYFDWSPDGKSWVSNQYERARRWAVTGIGIGHKFDNTSMKARFPFARFKDDSSKDQILYGDRVNMWRAT